MQKLKKQLAQFGELTKFEANDKVLHIVIGKGFSPTNTVNVMALLLRYSSKQTVIEKAVTDDDNCEFLLQHNPQL